MDFDPEHIHDLTMYEIAGLITPEEKAYLDEVITINQDAFNIWQELHASITSEQLDEARESIRLINPQDIIRSVEKKQRRYSLIKTFSIAAAIIVSVGLLFLFNSGKKQYTTGKNLLLAETVDTLPVQLKLADGKIINLSAEKIPLNTTDKRFSNLPGQNTLTVPVGKDYSIILPDGSKVHLSAASTLSFPFQFTGKTREIKMTGEVFVEAAPRAQQPLLVQTPSSLVKVLGTEFNVNAYDPHAERVALVSGKVSIHHNNDSAVIKPGNEGVVGTGKIITRSFDVATVLERKEGIYDLENISLSEVCDLLYRYYAVTAVIDNEKIKTKTSISQMGKNIKIKDYLENFKSTNHINYHYDNKGVVHFN